MLSIFFSHFSIVFSLLQKQSAAKIHIAKCGTISLFEFIACFGLLQNATSRKRVAADTRDRRLV